MNIFVWNLTEMWNSIKNTAHCTNRAGSSVFIGVLSSAVLSQHCTNTALTLHMHCLQGKALQLQHYNKSVPIRKKRRTRQTLWGECTDANLKTVAKRYMIEKK